MMFNQNTIRMLELCLDVYKSNKEIAHILNCDPKAIGGLRKVMGVKSLQTIFRPEDMDLLMDKTLAPSVVAEMIGCSAASVWNQRKKLGFYRKYRKLRYIKPKAQR